MEDIVQAYYATLQGNDGTLFAQFTPQCRHVVNGVTTVEGTDKTAACQALFSRGAFRAVERVRERQIRAVDEARGIVVASALLDRPAADGKAGRVEDIAYPHTQGVVEFFRIENGRIARVEAVSALMPYGMPPPWK
jgi:hypothetical protein